MIKCNLNNNSLSMKQYELKWNFLFGMKLQFYIKNKICHKMAPKYAY